MKWTRFALSMDVMMATANLSPGQHMPGGRMGRMPGYDAAKETTIQGTVEEVRTGRGMMMGVGVAASGFGTSGPGAGGCLPQPPSPDAIARIAAI